MSNTLLASETSWRHSEGVWEKGFDKGKLSFMSFVCLNKLGIHSLACACLLFALIYFA